MLTIERPGRRPIIVNTPRDPEHARLWSLALSKFQARTGGAPTTKADADAVAQDYHALLGKQRGAVSQVIREICEKAPGGD